jgi:hypothetical protein
MKKKKKNSKKLPLSVYDNFELEDESNITADRLRDRIVNFDKYEAEWL